MSFSDNHAFLKSSDIRSLTLSLAWPALEALLPPPLSSLLLLLTACISFDLLGTKPEGFGLGGATEGMAKEGKLVTA